MKHATFFISQIQYDWLSSHLPEPTPPIGPKPIPNNELLNGVLFVLKTGCRWQDIPSSVCKRGYSSCWRRLKYWQVSGGLQANWQHVLSLLTCQRKLDLSVGNLDGSLVQAPRFEATGYSGKHHRWGTNMSLLTDKQGLPLTEVLSPGNRHDQFSAAATLTKLHVATGYHLPVLNADKGYDALHFRQYLAEQSITANIPARNFVRRPRLQPVVYRKAIGRLRASVERTNAWLKYYRKLRYRWERSRVMFQAFVDLACLVTCLRRAM